MSVKLVDPMPLHPLLCYPGTNRPLRAIALNGNGLPIWPMLGSDDGDEGGDEGEDSEDEEESDEAEEESEEDSDTGKKKPGKSRRTGPVSREEFDAQANRLSAADKRRAAAEKEAADLRKFKEEHERKGNTELQNLQKDHTELTKNHENLQGRFKKLAMENAFHTASAQEKVSWHDPKVALRAADLDDLEIDEDGNVEGIRDVVKALAKSKKFLVNSGKETDDDEDGEDKKPVRRGASGSGVGSTKTGKGKPKNGQMTDEELKRRFPALNR